MLVSDSLFISTLAFTWPNWMVAGITVLFLAVCVVMVLTVLIQKPQGGGLASAFGGGASAGQTAFGTKTGDALTVFTIAVFVLYLLCAIVLNYAARPQLPAAATPTLEAPADGAAPATPSENAPIEAPPAANPAPVDPAATPVTSPPAPEGSATPTTPAATPPATPGSSPPAATPPATTPSAPPAPGDAPANPEPKTNPGR